MPKSTSQIAIVVESETVLENSIALLNSLQQNSQLQISFIWIPGNPRNSPISTIKSKITQISHPYPISIVNSNEELVNAPLDAIAYIPHHANPNPTLPKLPSTSEPWIVPWLPSLDFPPETAIAKSPQPLAWIADATWFRRRFANADIANADIPTLYRLAEDFPELAWYGGTSATPQPDNFPDKLRVCAIVPHLGCEPWLFQCLHSLVHQTRPLDEVVVVDDASPTPPVEIVSQFPAVKLLRSPKRVGPYRLVQQVIEETDADAYLFQDADDFSTRDRLATLLYLMYNHNADLVGTQELRIMESQKTVIPVCYPLDVNLALAEKPGHPLIHPSSLLRRDLVMQLGGFATGLKFGGDTEFLLRANFLARIVNTSSFLYCRRKRPNSLTTTPETGLDSPARTQLLQQLKFRARQNLHAKQNGEILDLTPLSVAPRLTLFTALSSPKSN
ncbi:glycosyltransferase family 2 protein [Baaleninema sp.]|uniref:glycosyltransferase family 2 protein n=1 Tax=Baaleninema sp. TaxID=3101197 RepID=UPI003D03AB9B